MIVDSATPPTATPTYDRFGNTILDVSGRFGQYRVRSAWDGRILRVCGEAASRTHLPFWRYDPGERRMVCGVCWPGKLSERQSEQRATSMDMTASVTPRPETSSETSSKSEGTSHV